MPLMDKEERKKKSPASCGGLYQDFGNFGVEDTAYIKAVVIDGQMLHSIHAADGTPLTIVAERDLAFATVRQHDLQPVSVH